MLGRSRVKQKIDHAVGFEVLHKTGAKVIPGTPLLRVHHQKNLSESFTQRCLDAFTVGSQMVTQQGLIIRCLTQENIDV